MSVQVKKTSLLVLRLATAALSLGILAQGCSETVEERPALVNQMESGKAPASLTGFFGADYSKLRPGGEGKAALVYINPNANWGQYNKILLEPVEFWDSAHSTIPPSDQQALTTYGYNQLKQDLQQHFTMVDRRGPGVMVLRVALIDATAATPGLRSVSVVIPQVQLLNRLQSLGTGSYAFAGSAEGEMKLTDATTGELLAAAVDKRAGGVALSTAAQWKWGDAQNAMNYWARRITDRLLELQGRSTARE
jgi:hypothetical protein